MFIYVLVEATKNNFKIVQQHSRFEPNISEKPLSVLGW